MCDRNELVGDGGGGQCVYEVEKSNNKASGPAQSIYPDCRSRRSAEYNRQTTIPYIVSYRQPGQATVKTATITTTYPSHFKSEFIFYMKIPSSTRHITQGNQLWYAESHICAVFLFLFSLDFRRTMNIYIHIRIESSTFTATHTHPHTHTQVFHLDPVVAGFAQKPKTI